MSRITVFKHPDSILTLRDLLFGPISNQKRGLALSKALETRAPLPPSVHVTCLLIATLHADLPQTDLYAIRQAYSMAIIRFVNEILDSSQVAKNVIPLHVLAAECGLPNSFVELRHAATHEDLPSIYLLREMCLKALDWLHDRFWSKQEVTCSPSKSSHSNGTRTQPCTQITDNGDRIKAQFSEWRRMKRENSVCEIPEDLIANLTQDFELHEPEFLNVLLNRNVLVPAGSTELPKRGIQVINLYLPLFQALGNSVCQAIATKVVQELQNREWPQLNINSKPQDFRRNQLLELWSEKLAGYLPPPIINEIKKLPRPWNCEVLGIYANLNGDQQLYNTAVDMADLLGLQIREEFEFVVWKKVPNWKPRPIGSS